MNEWFDEQLGRITMYRLVIYGLIAMAAMGILLAITGTAAFTATAFLLTLGTLVAVSYAANRLFGWLFGVTPQGESAIITGMILAFLFTPAVTPLALFKLALVAVIAMASKYIIAPRGRHIFNPAGIAVVIASVSGLAFAGWWVATSAMLPITIIVGTLILYRTKKLTMVSVFLVVAIVMLLLRGTDPVTAMVSWPLLFFGAIMLSEPLTLPPRAKQQYIVAAIVGVLIVLPFHYGPVSMTPALALVVGNIISWAYGSRGAIKLRYAGKKQLGEHAYDFTFDTKKLSFEPGQYIELTLPHHHVDSRGKRRIFSIVARPGDEQLSIGVKVPKKPSSFKRALMNLRTGDTVYATRMAGDFVLPDDAKTPIVCIAGGIGITPFISYYLSSDRPIKLIYAVNAISDVSFVEQLRHHAVDVTVVSPDSAQLPDVEWKHVRGHLDDATLKELLKDSHGATVYVSGPPAMVVGTRRIVRSLGIKNIKVDEFAGY